MSSYDSGKCSIETVGAKAVQPHCRASAVRCRKCNGDGVTMNIYLLGSLAVGLLVSLLYAWAYPRMFDGMKAPRSELFMSVFLWPFVLVALLYAAFERFRRP